MHGAMRLSAGFQWGVGARGGMVWSLLDNQWLSGLAGRSGTMHVKCEAGARTLNDSALLYASIAATHGACLNDEE